MTIVTISQRNQVVLPRAACDRLGLHPGQQLQAVLHGDRIVLLPLRPAASLRGFLKGIASGALRADNGECDS
jgi:AbrB family looped-hinge helix DNA binding protein